MLAAEVILEEDAANNRDKVLPQNNCFLMRA